MLRIIIRGIRDSKAQEAYNWLIVLVNIFDCHKNRVGRLRFKSTILVWCGKLFTIKWLCYQELQYLAFNGIASSLIFRSLDSKKRSHRGIKYCEPREIILLILKVSGIIWALIMENGIDQSDNSISCFMLKIREEG